MRDAHTSCEVLAVQLIKMGHRSGYPIGAASALIVTHPRNHHRCYHAYMNDSPQILLQPENPRQVESDDLLPLAARLKELNRNYDVRITSYEGPPADPDVEYEDAVVESWAEVVFLWVSPELGKAAIAVIVQQAFDWAKARIQEPDREARPIRLETVRYTKDEHGEVTETFVIESADEEAIHRILEKHERYPVLKPKLKEDEPNS